MKTSYTGIDVTNDPSVTEKVVKISDDKPALVTYEVEGAGGTAQEIISVTKDGVYRHESNGFKISPPLRFIAFPLKADAKWTSNSKTEGIPINNKYTCTVEKVKVPAGEFECFVISGATTWSA